MGDPFISLKEIGSLIESMHLSSDEEDFIRFVLHHENYSATVRGEDGYFIEKGPRNDDSFRGLGQFGSPAWSDVMSEPYALVGTPRLDLLAIVRYYRQSRRSFLNAFGNKEFSHELGYLYHNQGPGAAKSYLRTNNLRFPGQSAAALVTLAKAREGFKRNA